MGKATKTMTLTFLESNNRSPQKMVNIPNFREIVGITIDNGSAAFSVSGNDITFQASNGVAVGTSESWDPYYYSKAASTYDTSSFNSFASSFPYSDSQGYSGTLSRSGGSYVSSGSPADSRTESGSKSDSGTCPTSAGCWTKEQSGMYSSYPYNDGVYSGTLYETYYDYVSDADGTGSYNWSRYQEYSGTVSKPDTRVYRQDYSGTAYKGETVISNTYAYTMTIEYIDNLLPSVSAEVNTTPLADNQSILVTTKDDVMLEPTPNDPDAEDSVQIRYSLRGAPRTAFAPAIKGTKAQHAIPHQDLVLGNNIVEIEVMDDYGELGKTSVVLRNRVPETLSLQSVSEVLTAMNYPHDSKVDINGLLPSHYTSGNFSFSEIINTLT
jgi:hypothetical protein